MGPQALVKLQIAKIGLSFDLSRTGGVGVGHSFLRVGFRFVLRVLASFDLLGCAALCCALRRSVFRFIF